MGNSNNAFGYVTFDYVSYLCRATKPSTYSVTYSNHSVGRALGIHWSTEWIKGTEFDAEYYFHETEDFPAPKMTMKQILAAHYRKGTVSQSTLLRDFTTLLRDFGL
jgi:hypothetical protein